ncbi:MAG: hypothetical protein AAF637_27520, partial [Pseudomonadota bacterium]
MVDFARRPLAGRVAGWTACWLLASAPFAAQVMANPGPQPRTDPSIQTVSPDGKTTFVTTGKAIFPEGNPFTDQPPPNLLPTIYEDMADGLGNVMPNTLPSTPERPYNLHPEPTITDINPRSPTTDLREILHLLDESLDDSLVEQPLARLAIDIIEGNPIPDRAYSGFPLLHYKGPEQVKVVEPIHDAAGNVIGGNVDVHMIFFDNHIESDTMFVDPSEVLEVPWTVTYTVDVLDRGSDDFSPFAIYTDDPAIDPDGPPLPHVGMDQTFFPMDVGTRTVFEIGMTSGKYLNLIYTWGWRIHPPRIQAIENARKEIRGKKLPEWEIDVFGEAPSSSEEAKLAAIAMIGDLSPAKRMWQAFQEIAATNSPEHAADALERAQAAFD